jgi:hypothetical protein
MESKEMAASGERITLPVPHHATIMPGIETLANPKPAFGRLGCWGRIAPKVLLPERGV